MSGTKAKLRPGAEIVLHPSLADYDSGDDDTLCDSYNRFSFTEAQLQTLNSRVKLTNADGSYQGGRCEVFVLLPRV